MKKILLTLLLICSNLFNQTSKEIIIYQQNDYLCFYNLTTKQNYQNVLKIGPTVNHFLNYKDHIIITNSGVWGAGTNVQIVPLSAFSDYTLNQDTSLFSSRVKKIMLSNNGNAFTSAGFSDSLALVTLGQTSQLQIINFITGNSVEIINVSNLGNPQGSLNYDSLNIAICMADWGAGLGKYLSIFNVASRTIVKNILIHKNAIDVIKLKNGNLLAYCWGDWFGADNYGTIHIINKNTLTLQNSYTLPNAIKANYVTQLTDSTLYIYGFDQNYQDKFLLFNFNSGQFSFIETGLLKNKIVGRFNDGRIILLKDNKTFVLNENFQPLDSFNVNVGNILCTAKLTENTTCKTISIKNGWNLISIPLNLSNMHISTIFPQAVSPAYKYNNGYITEDTLKTGTGYWIKFNNNLNIDLCGQLTNLSQIDINQGWNLIGPFDREISVSQITTIPSNILISPFYGYDDGYLQTDTLKPGKAYWIKSSVNGKIILN